MIREDVYWINFKEPDKLRPALVITRDSAISYLNSVTVIPTTTTVRDNPSTVGSTKKMGCRNYVLLCR